MCTVVLALGCDARWPLVVAANRDEKLDRPSEGWSVRRVPGCPSVACPRDVVAGGTWVGVSARGVVAAVTNHYTGRPPDPALRSRGELVGRALRHPSAAAAAHAMAGLDAATYNPFHLVVADLHGGWRLEPGLPPAALAPGLHVVTESSAHGTDARSDLVRARWPSSVTVAALAEVLSLHHADPRHATCVHLGGVYGTRSSTILLAGQDLATWGLHVTGHAPCRSPHQDASDLLRALDLAVS
jgi:uncharacterized protein with NRDE domain